MTEDIVISVKNVTKTYRLYDSHADRVKETFHPWRKKYHHPFSALTNVSFDVRKGETFGIVCRNGSGKSTLLQIICGILRPISGTVEVNGRVLDKIDETLRRMDDGFRGTGEEIDEGFRLTGEKMDEGFQLIAKLIVEENEKTRKEILQALKS